MQKHQSFVDRSKATANYMKKIISLCLAMCMVICLAACGNRGSEAPTAPDDSPEGSGGAPVQTPAPAPTAPSVIPEPAKPEPADATPQLLNLQKNFNNLYEWDEDALLVRSEFSRVTLLEEDATAYGKLAETLQQTSGMIQSSMEDEFSNLVSSAQEILSAGGAAPETSVSTLDIQLRRADSVAFSLLSDSYADFGLIEDFRAMHGTNYDTQTGQALQLSDVIQDMSPVPAAVAQELGSHMWAGDFNYDAAVADYFRSTPADAISWTLDYNGVTFYFGDGDLLEDCGRLTATVSFAEHPELFAEKYIAAPSAYMVELPLDSSFFTDLDGDGDLEEINVTGWYSSDELAYTKFGIYSDADGCFQYEECSADGLVPYYVKTDDGRHYLYLFLEHYEGAFPMYSLNVFDLSGGKAVNVGNMPVGPAYIPVNSIRVPTDPKQLYLEHFSETAPGVMTCFVGPNGLPEGN